MNTSQTTGCIDKDEEIARISIKRGGVNKSSVSMDAYLAQMLEIELLKKGQTLQRWVQETCDRLDSQWDTAAMSMKSGDRVRAKSGVSRLIQREAIKYLLGRKGRRLANEVDEANAQTESDEGNSIKSSDSGNASQQVNPKRRPGKEPSAPQTPPMEVRQGYELKEFEGD